MLCVNVWPLSVVNWEYQTLEDICTEVPQQHTLAQHWLEDNLPSLFIFGPQSVKIFQTPPTFTLTWEYLARCNIFIRNCQDLVQVISMSTQDDLCQDPVQVMLRSNADDYKVGPCNVSNNSWNHQLSW